MKKEKLTFYNSISTEVNGVHMRYTKALPNSTIVKRKKGRTQELVFSNGSTSLRLDARQINSLKAMLSKL